MPQASQMTDTEHQAAHWQKGQAQPEQTCSLQQYFVGCARLPRMAWHRTKKCKQDSKLCMLCCAET